uniref:Uncharacterized protein n=1 Tax=Kwoniella bestiolae CBS 10118 TaxID=1296100 RepID=A0A1B9G3J0_9TREE|nr:hypothetical protein I302_05403 [Kwoniella bestiolae CBS 10118]OCF25583.1 hypothetical protein I302_05403 [Kwoniella bestiolae CBS 10118]
MNFTAQQRNLTYTNDFLSCLCAGTNSTGTLGPELMADSASFCMGCEATPKKIKDNLGTFLGLCQVQSSNGTATNATEFMPVGYSTSNDRSKDAVTGWQGRQYTLDRHFLVGMTAVLGLVSWTIV